MTPLRCLTSCLCLLPAATQKPTGFRPLPLSGDLLLNWTPFVPITQNSNSREPWGRAVCSRWAGLPLVLPTPIPLGRLPLD